MEFFSILASTFRFATPLLLGALGALVCERSGVINLAVEGTMLTGAFAAAAVAALTGDPWLGLLAAIVAGTVVASVHAGATVGLGADQVVSGDSLGGASAQPDQLAGAGDHLQP